MDGGGVPHARRLRFDAVALPSIIAVAAITRLTGLDLMEFKGDEADACRLALHALGYGEPGVRNFFPTAGLTSSVGLPNPPLFIYLIALPLAVVRSPIAAAAFVAATNVVAVWLCYLVGTRYFSRFVGIASAALFALSPWGIVFSRKVWAQDTLPVFAGLFLLALHAFVVNKRPRAAFWLIVLVACATQIHFSAWILLPLLAAAFVIGRAVIDWRWVGLGVAAATALYAPFLVYHGVASFNALGHASGDAGVNAVGRFEDAARFMLAIPGGDRMSFVLGSQSALARPLSLLLGPLAFGGLLLGLRQWRRTPLGSARVLLAVWYVLPLVALTALRTPSYMHYFIILFPLPFIGIAVALEQLTRFRAAAGWLALAGCLGCFAHLDGRFFQTIADQGGAAGDYGIAYRYKADAAAMVVRANPGRTVEIGTDTSFGPGQATEYRFLVWNRRPEYRPAPGTTAAKYVFVDTFHDAAPVSPTGQAYPATRFGPLAIVTVTPSR